MSIVIDESSNKGIYINPTGSNPQLLDLTTLPAPAHELIRYPSSSNSTIVFDAALLPTDMRTSIDSVAVSLTISGYRSDSGQGRAEDLNVPQILTTNFYDSPEDYGPTPTGVVSALLWRPVTSPHLLTTTETVGAVQTTKAQILNNQLVAYYTPVYTTLVVDKLEKTSTLPSDRLTVSAFSKPAAAANILSDGTHPLASSSQLLSSESEIILPPPYSAVAVENDTFYPHLCGITVDIHGASFEPTNGISSLYTWYTYVYEKGTPSRIFISI